jgi:hypothetical protein
MAQKGTVGSLVVELRAELGQLRFDLQNVEKTFQSSFAKIKTDALSFGKTLAGAFGIGLSVGAVVNYGKSIIALGGQLKDLSEQTGIAASTLSGIKTTLEQNSTNIDAFSKGIFNLQKNIGSIKNASDPVAQAVKALGLNLDELRSADTDKFLELIVNALGRVENPMQRNALAAQLMGKSARELVPAILALVGQLNNLRHAGLTDEEIDRLKKTGDALTYFWNKVEIITVERIQKTIKEIKDVKAFFDRLGGFEKPIPDLLTGDTGKLPPPPAKPPIDTETINQTRAFLEGLQKQAEALRVNAVELTEGSRAAKALGLDLEFAAFKAKLLAEEKVLPAGAAAEFAKLKAEVLGAGDALDGIKLQLAAVAESIKEAQTKEDQFTQGLLDWERALKSLATEGLSDTDKALADVGQHFQDLRDQLIKAAVDGTIAWEDFYQAIDKTKLLESIAKKQVAAEQKGPAETQVLAAKFAALDSELGHAQAFSQALGETFNFTSQAIQLQTEKVKLLVEQYGALDPVTQQAVQDLKQLQATQDLRATFHEITDAFSSGIRETIIGIERGDQSLGEGLRNMFRNALLSVNAVILDKTILEPIKASINAFFDGFVEAFGAAGDSAAKDIAKNLGRSLGNWLSDLFGGGGGGGGFSLLSLFGFGKGGEVPEFATGGPVPAILHSGEFVMSRRAVDAIGMSNLEFANKNLKMPALIPHFAMGGPVGNWSNARAGGMHIDNLTINAQGAERGVHRDIERAMNQIRAEIPGRAITAVHDNRRRSNNAARIFGR